MRMLYDISNEYIDALNECYQEEFLSEELIEKIELINDSFNEKVKNIALLIVEIQADCEKIENEEKRLKSRRESKEKSVQRLKEYLKGRMTLIGKSKIETPTHTISIRKSVKAEVDELFIEWARKNHEERFIDSTTTHKPNKRLIKERLQSGELNCPYAKLIESQSLSIR